MFKDKYIFLSMADSYNYGVITDEDTNGFVLFKPLICKKHPHGKFLINVHDYRDCSTSDQYLLAFDTEEELMAYVEWIEAPQTKTTNIVKMHERLH
jgi:hypothetical protein